jgi:hypothetical protein
MFVSWPQEFQLRQVLPHPWPAGCDVEPLPYRSHDHILLIIRRPHPRTYSISTLWARVTRCVFVWATICGEHWIHFETSTKLKHLYRHCLCKQRQNYLAFRTSDGRKRYNVSITILNNYTGPPFIFLFAFPFRLIPPSVARFNCLQSIAPAHAGFLSVCSAGVVPQSCGVKPQWRPRFKRLRWT